MGSKSKVRSMQRGAHKRSEEKAETSKELYDVSPPKLSDDEIPHFSFRTRNFDKFFDEISPILMACHRNGLAASGVAKVLNGKQIRTACNAKWTPRLAWFLMKTWRTINLRPRAEKSAQPRLSGNGKPAGIDLAAERASRKEFRDHLRQHFRNPSLGEAFPELAELRARLEAGRDGAAGT